MRHAGLTLFVLLMVGCGSGKSLQPSNPQAHFQPDAGGAAPTPTPAPSSTPTPTPTSTPTPTPAPSSSPTSTPTPPPEPPACTLTASSSKIGLTRPLTLTLTTTGVVNSSTIDGATPNAAGAYTFTPATAGVLTSTGRVYGPLVSNSCTVNYEVSDYVVELKSGVDPVAPTLTGIPVDDVGCLYVDYKTGQLFGKAFGPGNSVAIHSQFVIKKKSGQTVAVNTGNLVAPANGALTAVSNALTGFDFSFVAGGSGVATYSGYTGFGVPRGAEPAITNNLAITGTNLIGFCYDDAGPSGSPYLYVNFNLTGG